MFTKILSTFLFISTLLAAEVSSANDDTPEQAVKFESLNGFMGIPVGLAHFGGRFGYSFGAMVGTIFEGGVRTALQFQYYGKSDEYQDTTGKMNKSSTFVNVGTEFALFLTKLGLNAPGAAIGFKVGLGTYAHAQEQNGVSTNLDSKTGFFIGPEITYDYLVAGGLSIGGELSYVNGPSGSALLILMPFKFWF